MARFNVPGPMQALGKSFLKAISKDADDRQLYEGLRWFEQEVLPYLYYGTDSTGASIDD